MPNIMVMIYNQISCNEFHTHRDTYSNIHIRTASVMFRERCAAEPFEIYHCCIGRLFLAVLRNAPIKGLHLRTQRDFSHFRFAPNITGAPLYPLHAYIHDDSGDDISSISDIAPYINNTISHLSGEEAPYSSLNIT